MIDEHKLPYIKYLAFFVFSAPFFFWSAFFPVSVSVWLGLSAGALLALPFLWLYFRALRPFSVAPFPLLLAAALLALVLALAFFRAQNLFLERCLFPQLPLWALSLVLALFTIWMAVRGLLPLLGFAGLAGIPVLLLFLLSIISSASKIDPHFVSGLLPFSLRGFLSSAPVAGALFLLQGLVLLTALTQTEKPKAVFRETVLGLIISVILLSAAHWVAALALGPHVFESLPFQLYYPPGLTGTAEYLERTELLLLMVFFFSAVSNLSFLLLTVKNGLPFLKTKPAGGTEPGA